MAPQSRVAKDKSVTAMARRREGSQCGRVNTGGKPVQRKKTSESEGNQWMTDQQQREQVDKISEQEERKDD
eukprot:3814865-Rhodomonas_salina.1